MGGEKKSKTKYSQEQEGSPPRGRGKEPICMSMFWRFGITPAWAGKRGKRRKRQQQTEDHPRVGGEKLALGSCKQMALGSPPRGRGKVDAVRLSVRCFGITPAWAGKSRQRGRRGRRRQDHPRVGGEKYGSGSAQHSQKGSPPRGRGKVSNTAVGYAEVRITPAWAGKSRPRTSLTQYAKDHPRVGGEKNC